MSMKISFAEVQAAQQVVASAVQEMNTLTRQILNQADAAELAMRAPAGRVTSQTFGHLGGSGKALAESLTELHNDLNRLQRSAAEGSDTATRIARSAADGGAALAVSSGM